MKTPSTYLYDLVHSLTKSEKRYVKVRAGTGNKDYLQLMDALLSQKQFDEQELIRDFKVANFVKHLAVSKRYLYDTLLEALTHFGQQTLEQKVFEKISAVHVLTEKNLFPAAYSELKKGIKIAGKYELFELQILLNGISKRLRSKQPLKKDKGEAVRHLYRAEVECLAQLKNTNEYWHLAQRMIEFQTRFQKIQSEEQRAYLSKLTESPLFNDQKLATNFRSKTFFYQANSIYQFMLGNVKEAYEINGQFLDLMEANSHFLKINAQRYLATLNNMLIDSLMIGEYDVLETGIARLVKTQERPEFKSIKNIESRVFRQRYLLLLNWSLSQKDFDRATQWIPEIEEGLQRYGTKIEKHHRLTFYYLIAYLLFQIGRFEEALKWNNLIVNDPKEDVVKEIFHFARILNLLIHYELKNFILLESLLLSTPKYLKSRRAIYATEKALFRFLRKSINNIDQATQRKLTADFQSELQGLFADPGEKRVFNYLDLRAWASLGLSKRSEV